MLVEEGRGDKTRARRSSPVGVSTHCSHVATESIIEVKGQTVDQMPALTNEHVENIMFRQESDLFIHQMKLVG